MSTRKQNVLDKTAQNDNEAILQQMLYSYSKTKLENLRRSLNEFNTLVLFKTQYRTLPFVEILNEINTAVAINQEDEERDKY